MRVRVLDPGCTDDLTAFLRTRIGAIVDQAQRDELEVSLLGSFSAGAMREELEAAVLRWQLARQSHGTAVEIE
jgi:hypothetical protein